MIEFEPTLEYLKGVYTTERMIIFFTLFFIVGLGGRTAKHLGDKGATYKNSLLCLLLAIGFLKYVPEQWSMSVLLVILAILIIYFRRRKTDDG